MEVAAVLVIIAILFIVKTVKVVPQQERPGWSKGWANSTPAWPRV